jgi:hypothetical protein
MQWAQVLNFQAACAYVCLGAVAAVTATFKHAPHVESNMSSLCSRMSD